MDHIDVHRLVDTLHSDLRTGLEGAASLASRRRNSSVEVVHWLQALLECENKLLLRVLSEFKIEVRQLKCELDYSLHLLPIEEDASLTLSQNLLNLVREAWLVASIQFGRRCVSLFDLLLALCSSPSEDPRHIAPSLLGLNAPKLRTFAAKLDDEPLLVSGAVEERGYIGAGQFLELYTHDMTAEARAGKLDAVVGRERELRQLLDVLTRRRQNNPILVGEAGVGKTAVAEALALEIVKGNIPKPLHGVRLLMLDLSLLEAGAGIKGEFERRLHGVVGEIKASVTPIILFIDEAHALVGAGGGVSQNDAANILKPALARGELRTIAATTWSEYKRYFEKDAALSRRFQPIAISEPDEESALRMLRGMVDVFSEHHGVQIRESALNAAVRLSTRYIASRQLPDKAISVLDTAAAYVAMARQSFPEELDAAHNEMHVLEAEMARLRIEPAHEEIDVRIAELARQKSVLQDQISELQVRYQRELMLVEQADMLEKALGPHSEIQLSHHEREKFQNQLAMVHAELNEVIIEQPLVPQVVDGDVIAKIVARWTGIPIGKLLCNQIEAIIDLENRLKQRVHGQDNVIARIAAAMRISRAGLSDPRRPPAVFLFVGMSGTGKTEMAHALTEILYGDRNSITIINMSEFKEEHKVSMLVGSPPGYVGYGEGGILTEAVRRRPYGVLLLDEMDKAHPGVQDLFYQVFDKGSLRDGEGRDIDFKNTTIIMTANTGSELLSSFLTEKAIPTDEALNVLLLPTLKEQFKPAFLGRTMVLPFLPLDENTLATIVELQIDVVRKRVLERYGATLSLSDSARMALIENARCSETGARMIEAMIARDLLPILSSFFLNAVVDGRVIDSVSVEFSANSFQLRELPTADNPG
ncbi:type VI secretion system ATPase TssH [Ochrobactrum sp. GPK 3]|uniref:type VI secretion system ATPase TssH n=1 Tax=Brucella sp. 22210 TaxID=3453892 RepID=UPI0031385168